MIEVFAVLTVGTVTEFDRHVHKMHKYNWSNLVTMYTRHYCWLRKTNTFFRPVILPWIVPGTQLP